MGYDEVIDVAVNLLTTSVVHGVEISVVGSEGYVAPHVVNDVGYDFAIACGRGLLGSGCAYCRINV